MFGFSDSDKDKMYEPEDDTYGQTKINKEMVELRSH